MSASRGRGRPPKAPPVVQRIATPERLAAAAALWGAADAQTRQRTAMLIAAWLLDDALEIPNRDNQLADWLRLAKPENARAVATNVAVHALRRGYPCVWDCLAAVDAMDIEQASEWFDAAEGYAWAPEPGWLADPGEPVQAGGDSPDSVGVADTQKRHC